MSNSKIVILACGLALAACGLFLGSKVMSEENATSQRQTGDTEVNLISPAFFSAQSIKTGILRIERKKNVIELPLEKLDFSWPGEAGYGDDPSFEVFNPEGGGASFTDYSKVSDYWKNYWKDYTEGYPRFIMTFGNRVSGLGTDKTELIAVLPKVKEFPCELFNKNRHQNIIPKLEKNINLTPHPQEVPENEIVTLPNEEGCISTPDGYYYYSVLVAR